jgi:hypothetical protein
MVEPSGGEIREKAGRASPHKLHRGFKNDTVGFENDTTGFKSDTAGFRNDTAGFKNDTTGFTNETEGFNDEPTIRGNGGRGGGCGMLAEGAHGEEQVSDADPYESVNGRLARTNGSLLR